MLGPEGLGLLPIPDYHGLGMHVGRHHCRQHVHAGKANAVHGDNLSQGVLGQACHSPAALAAACIGQTHAITDKHP